MTSMISLTSLQHVASLPFGSDRVIGHWLSADWLIG
jgi:hypothetical protein